MHSEELFSFFFQSNVFKVFWLVASAKHDSPCSLAFFFLLFDMDMIDFLHVYD